MRCFLFLVGLLASGMCFAADYVRYYQTHPEALQKALQACPTSSPTGLTCDDLRHMAERMNELAYQLRSNPQEFGQTILALQEELAKQKVALQQNPSLPDLLAAYESNQQLLQVKLAVVRWLESPVGR